MALVHLFRKTATANTKSGAAPIELPVMTYLIDHGAVAREGTLVKTGDKPREKAMQDVAAQHFYRFKATLAATGAQIFQVDKENHDRVAVLNARRAGVEDEMTTVPIGEYVEVPLPTTPWSLRARVHLGLYFVFYVGIVIWGWFAITRFLAAQAAFIGDDTAVNIVGGLSLFLGLPLKAMYDRAHERLRAKLLSGYAILAGAAAITWYVVGGLQTMYDLDLARQGVLGAAMAGGATASDWLPVAKFTAQGAFEMFASALAIINVFDIWKRHGRHRERREWVASQRRAALAALSQGIEAEIGVLRGQIEAMGKWLAAQEAAIEAAVREAQSRLAEQLVTH